MVIFIFFFFRLEIRFLGWFGPKIQNCQLNLKFGNYNHAHKILRLFDVWAYFPFTTSEAKRDY